MTDSPIAEHDENARTLPPWWAVLLVVLAIAGAAFAIGRFTAFGATAAPATPTSDSADAGFARDMQVHHAQAITMAMTIYRETSDEEIRTVAYDIATGQSAQKGEFYDWLVKWNLPQLDGPLMAWMTDASGHVHGTDTATASVTEMEAAMGMASAAEMAELDSSTGQAADCLFLELMIRHHEGAIPMAQALLERGSDPRALEVAGGVIATQSAEIDLMRAAQLRLGCS